MLIFYMVQNNYQIKIEIFFEDLLPYISGAIPNVGLVYPADNFATTPYS
jgi:hypothetical protein